MDKWFLVVYWIFWLFWLVALCGCIVFFLIGIFNSFSKAQELLFLVGILFSACNWLFVIRSANAD
jgi:hypothetical protein